MKSMKHITWVLLLLAASLLTACEKEVSGPPYADTLKSYYLESTRLGSETLDSINNFVLKVNTLSAAWPEVKDEPEFLGIVENVNMYRFQIKITINGEWDGIIEIKK